MYFWNSYPFVRFSTALICGILLFDHFPTLHAIPIYLGLVLLVIYLVCVIASKKVGFYKLRYVNGFLALALLLLIGGFTLRSKYHSHPEFHYRFLDAKITGFSGIITSSVNERTNHYRYLLDLTTTKTDTIQKSYGKIHLYVKKDSLNTSPLTYGDKIVVQGSFFPISPPGNPEEFHYKKYLERQNIYAHSFVNRYQINILSSRPQSWLLKSAYSLRSNAVSTINNHIVEKRENAISKALLLGVKDFLDNEIKQAYAAAGAMHVLAVSGLHVGIIYLILLTAFGKLKEKGNTWRLVFGVICVVTIWFYAIITGLSPSVMRAATMFSVIAIGEAFSREGNIYNSLGIAAFILLIYDPYLIYSVGFQLSFAAVIGIVYLQPKLFSLLRSRFWLMDKIWAITSVSIAAQLATFPLSAYYFHQFPTYFLASNLVVIPAAFIILIIGISMLVINPIIEVLGQLLGRILYHTIWCLNEIIEAVERLPNSLIEWIYMDQISLILTYLIVITCVLGLHYKSFKTLIIGAIFSLTWIGYSFHSHFNQFSEEKLIFYEIREHTAIDYIHGKKAKLFIDNDAADVELLSFQIDPYRLSSHLPPVTQSIEIIDNVFFEQDVLKFGMIGDKKIAFIDSTTFHLNFTNKIRTDILMINNESVKSLKWLRDNFKFEYLIIGNSNSYYYSNKMKNQAQAINIKIHSLGNDGAMILDLNEHKKRADNLPALFTTNPD